MKDPVDSKLPGFKKGKSQFKKATGAIKKARKPAGKMGGSKSGPGSKKGRSKK